jgi:hypothetical protein
MQAAKQGIEPHAASLKGLHLQARQRINIKAPHSASPVG